MAQLAWGGVSGDLALCAGIFLPWGLWHHPALW